MPARRRSSSTGSAISAFLLAMFLVIKHFGTLSFNQVFAEISAHAGLAWWLADLRLRCC